MKKMVLMSRHWIKVAASKTVGRLGELIDSFSSGGTPFIPFAPLPSPWSIGAAMETESLHRQQDYAYRQAYGAQQAGAIGGLQGQLLAQLMGAPPIYMSYTGGHVNILKEGKVNVQVKLTRIDKEHVLVEVECIKRIVHNAKELRELTAELIESHAEEFLFSELARKDTRDMSGAMDTKDPTAKEPIQSKHGHE